jgi:hypothetical protein
VWRRGADGKMERVSLSVIRQEYKKLNCDMFALTFGLQEISPMAQKMSKKHQRLNYKQNRCSIKRSGDMALMSLTKQFQLWLTFWLVHWQNISLLQQMTADIVVKPKN